MISITNGKVVITVGNNREAYEDVESHLLFAGSILRWLLVWRLEDKLDSFLDKIYYLLFVILGLFMIRYRDVLTLKIVESQRMVGFLFKRANMSKDKELIYTRRLCLVVGLAFITYGVFKLFIV